jgi:transposase
MEASQKSKSTKRYPPELKQRAVRMVLEAREHDPQDQGCIARIARQLGVGDQSLRNWVNQAETDRGKRSGLTSEERERLKALEKENRELRRSNEILKRASAFFAAELDRPQK